MPCCPYVGFSAIWAASHEHLRAEVDNACLQGECELTDMLARS